MNILWEPSYIFCDFCCFQKRVVTASFANSEFTRSSTLSLLYALTKECWDIIQFKTWNSTFLKNTILYQFIVNDSFVKYCKKKKTYFSLEIFLLCSRHQALRMRTCFSQFSCKTACIFTIMSEDLFEKMRNNNKNFNSRYFQRHNSITIFLVCKPCPSTVKSQFTGVVFNIVFCSALSEID